MSDPASKISANFAARIKARSSKKPVRAVLLLIVPHHGSSVPPAPDVGARKHKATSVIQSTQELLPQVDVILGKHHGKRLSPMPDAFGSVAVESTPAGILELAKQSWTKAIMEDQRIAAAG